jgi:hypothetical protein
MVFFGFWVGQAMKYTLGGKFGSPAQTWGRAGMGEGGVG